MVWAWLYRHCGEISGKLPAGTKECILSVTISPSRCEPRNSDLIPLLPLVNKVSLFINNILYMYISMLQLKRVVILRRRIGIGTLNKIARYDVLVILEDWNTQVYRETNTLK